MRPLRDLHLGAIRQQHPHRNFQASPRWVDDRDRAISPLRSAEDLKGSAMERMERVEDLDMRVFCAQGIVSVDGSIRICIVSSRAAEFHRMVPAGSPAAPTFSCPYGCSPGCSADCS